MSGMVVGEFPFLASVLARSGILGGPGADGIFGKTLARPTTREALLTSTRQFKGQIALGNT